MKTVEFKYKGNGLYFVDGERHLGDSYGTYVLVSEVDERIKVLEDALKEIKKHNYLWDDHASQLKTILTIARAALEVKP
jgi:hypothetical protein